jgi:hypothetical protein
MAALHIISADKEENTIIMLTYHRHKLLDLTARENLNHWYILYIIEMVVEDCRAPLPVLKTSLSLTELLGIREGVVYQELQTSDNPSAVSAANQGCGYSRTKLHKGASKAVNSVVQREIVHVECGRPFRTAISIRY